MPELTSVKPGFAARLEGVDAAHATDTDVAAVRSALAEHGVLVLPGQTLSEEEQVAFASRFGPLDGYQYASDDYNAGSRPDLLWVSNVDEAGQRLEVMDRRRMLDIGNKLWHSDSSFKTIPGHLSMLYGIKVASEGGETQFADLRAGYDALSADMKILVEDLVAEHSILHARSMMGFDDWNEEFRAKYGAWVAHRIVRRLPETGRKTLYLSSHASHIVGLPIPIGRMLLHELVDISTTPDKVYSHQWRQNDLVIWDNRCTLHRVRRYRASAEARIMRRVTTQATDFPATDPATVEVPDWIVEQAA